MNNKTEGMLSILAALLVLFSAMIDPRVSLALAVTCLLAFAIYKFAFASKRRTD
ncbi:MAG TPA: hypothetical protein VF478_10485 [Anaerolineae bacterium]